MAKQRKQVTEKHSGKSYAQAANEVSKKYKNRDTNPMEMRSFIGEMELLYKKQELARAKEIAMQSIKNYRKPANASKYQLGGFTDPTKPVETMIGTPLPQSVVDATAVGDYAPGYEYLSRLHSVKYGTPDTLQSLPMQSVDKAVEETNNPLTGGGGNIYSPLMIGKGLEAAGKLAMLAQGYNKVNPEFNPNENRIENLMANRNVNTQALQNQALSQQNVALQNLTDVRSPNVRRALVNNVIQSTLKNMQQSRLQQDQMNNAYAGEYANTLNALGQQRVQATNYAEQLNNQANAARDMSIMSMLQTVGETGQKLTDYKTNIAQQNLVTSMMRTKNFKSGKASDIFSKVINNEEVTQDDIILLANEEGKTVEETKKALKEAQDALLKLYPSKKADNGTK